MLKLFAAHKSSLCSLDVTAMELLACAAILDVEKTPFECSSTRINILGTVTILMNMVLHTVYMYSC